MASSTPGNLNNAPFGTASFAGRQNELAQIELWLGELAQHGPLLVSVCGEAGIGKSRFLHEVAQRARGSGLNVLGARCHEDSAVPLLAVVAALRSAAADLPALEEIIGGESASRETLAATIMVELGVQLVALSKRGAMVILIDDLHWADQGTLDVILHLAATLGFEAAASAVPLAIVVAHRPVVPASVARMLDRLGREPCFRRLVLGGLDEPALHALITSSTGLPPSRQLLHAVARVSQGNPFLVRTILERLIDAGSVVARGGRLTKVTSGELVVSSEGLDRELTLRLQRLDPTCRELLIAAAFLGTEGGLADLETLVGLAADEFEKTIERAVQAQVLEVHTSAYRFAHPLPRTLLADIPVGRRRQRLHLAVADQLEAASRPDESAVGAIEIARHLRHAGGLVTRQRLFRSNVEAGTQALRLEAWSEASVAFDAALEAATDDVSKQDRLAVMVQCGLAHGYDDDPAAAEPVLEQAIAVARSIGDVDRLVAAALTLARIRLTHAGGSAQGALEALRPILEHPEIDSRHKALAFGLQAEVLFSLNEFDRGTELSVAARSMAADTRDDVLAANIDMAAGLQHLGRLEFPEAEARFADGARLASRGGDRWLAQILADRVSVSQLGCGRLRAAETSAGRNSLDAATLRNWGDHSLLCAVRISVGALQGRFADVESYGASGIQSLRWSEYPFTPPLLFPALAAARAARGDAIAATQALATWTLGGGQGALACRLLVALTGGDPATGVGMSHWRPIGQRPSSLLLAPLVAQVELGAARRDPTLLEDALPALERLWDRGMAWTLQWPACTGRLAAMAQRVLGDLAAAESWLNEAMAVAIAEDARCEQARILLERARLAAARQTQGSVVSAAYENAIRAADACAMVPLLSTALAEAPAMPGQSELEVGGLDRRPRVVMFTDLVDSTPLLVRLGDQPYVELFRYLGHMVRRHAGDHHGVEFKRVGDGIDIWFDSAIDAVRCAQAILTDLDEHNRTNQDRLLRLRCGLAAGAPVPSETDLFGRTVVEAARVCARAVGGQILITDDLVPLLQGADVRLRRAGDVELKGLPGPTRIHEVVRTM